MVCFLFLRENHKKIIVRLFENFNFVLIHKKQERKMHFCTVCANMYYIQIDPENADQLIYYCRFCNHTDEKLAGNNTCVSKKVIKKTSKTYEHIINNYTKLDPTLPRVNKIPCPNANCKTNTEHSKDREIICIRYDTSNIKYVYLCSTCDTIFEL